MTKTFECTEASILKRITKTVLTVVGENFGCSGVVMVYRIRTLCTNMPFPLCENCYPDDALKCFKLT